MAGTIRTVIENVSVSLAVDVGQSRYPRLEDAYDALKWDLAHEPEIGEITDDVNWLYVQAGDMQVNIPELVVVYTFDHREVVLKHIRIIAPR